ncbi:tripartite tricarboxylate transporter substrate binding protein [Ramlibacter sp. MAHUQ-53]|uniref:tripartite tricarboxylate transporter substrate binding protein n=1 Tax=unclassified Ramlibacter TaxID=2617605 RepID=UPI00362735A9
MNGFGLALRRLRTWTVAAAAAVASLGALAQDWPARPVRIVVGGPAGGTADALARLVAEGLAPAIGKPVIVDAKPGAAGAIAVADLLKAPHDGHTLLLIQGGIVSETPQAYKVAFQPFRDLKPLVQVSRQGLILVANNQLPARNLKELVTHIKSQGGRMSYASYASGMRAHTSGVLFGRLAGVDLSHVGYKGSPPALQDVMGGHVPLMFDAPATSLPLIKAGKLKAYAVNFPTRLTALPEVPTFTELGFPALNDVGWMGLWSTPDLPAGIQARVREITLQYLKQPAVRQRIEAMGMETGLPLTSEELAKDLRAAYDQQGEILRSIQYKPE